MASWGASCVAEDSQHSVGEAAPVGDGIDESIGQLEGWVEVCDHLGGGVGSDDATKSRPVLEVGLCPFDPVV